MHKKMVIFALFGLILFTGRLTAAGESVDDDLVAALAAVGGASDRALAKGKKKKKRTFSLDLGNIRKKKKKKKNKQEQSDQIEDQTESDEQQELQSGQKPNKLTSSCSLGDWHLAAGTDRFRQQEPEREQHADVGKIEKEEVEGDCFVIAPASSISANIKRSRSLSLGSGSSGFVKKPCIRPAVNPDIGKKVHDLLRQMVRKRAALAQLKKAEESGLDEEVASLEVAVLSVEEDESQDRELFEEQLLNTSEFQEHLLDTPRDEFAGMTPLTYAAQFGLEDPVNLLLLAGASPDAFDRNEMTPLQAAARAGHTGIVNRLLVSGAQTDLVGRNGMTALHFAAQRGQSEAAEHLVCCGARKDIKDINKNTPFVHATNAGMPELAKFLKPAERQLTRSNSWTGKCPKKW